MQLTNNERNLLWEILNNNEFVLCDLYGVDQQELMNKLAGELAWLGSPVSEAESVLDELRDVIGPALESTDIWKIYKGETAERGN